MSKIRTAAFWLFALSLFAVSCGSDSAETETNQDSAAATQEDETSNDERMADEEATSEDDDHAGNDEAIADEDAMADDSQNDFPITIESAAGSFTLESAPQRIVSLSPSATEMLFAVGAGEQVIAVDAFSNYPAEAPVTDLSGFDPNVEAVLGFEPDLVVIANDANDLVAGLTAVGVPVLISAAPVDIESGYATFADLGLAAGRIDETAAAIAEMRTAIDQAMPGSSTAISVYHELDDTYFSASSFGFIGSIYSDLGLSNIADEADPDMTGFPQLSEEYIVQASPELIVITDQVGYTADDVAARPGWSEVSAVTNGNIVTVRADVASRWGPRLPQFIDALTAAITAAAPA